MKFVFLCLSFFLCFAALACSEKDVLVEAKKFIEKSAPDGAKVEVQKEDGQVSYTVIAKQGKDSYSETGVLAYEDSESCKFKSLTKQVQSQGDSFQPKETADDSLTVSMSDLVGSWQSPCVQTQNGNRQGYVTDSYAFKNDGEVRITRRWYKDSRCRGKSEVEQVQGQFALGKQNLNNGFNPQGTTELELRISGKKELGLVWLSEDHSTMRISRGFGSSQNTMLDLTQFKKN